MKKDLRHLLFGMLAACMLLGAFTSVASENINDTWVNDTASTLQIPPVADFTANQTSGHAPLHVLFTDTSTGDPTAWSWDFGDNANSTEQDPVHVYELAGTYNVTLTVTNNCGSDSTTKQEYIHVSQPCTLPVANFAADPTQGYSPLSVLFTDLSTGNPVSWSWDFGDNANSTEQNPFHVYELAGTYNVTLTVTNDCGSNSTTKTYTVTPPLPVPTFEGTPLSGKAPLNVSFTDTSTGTVTTRFWDFGDGTREWANATSTISHLYLIPGTYTVSLTVGNNGGEETLTRNAYIQVNPSGTTPFALFAASPMMGYAPLTVQFTDRSIGKPLKWQWDFGDGNTSSEQNPTHTYYSVGKYSPTLKVFNSGGSSTYSSLVWVRSPFVFSTITIPPTPTIPSFPTFTIPPTPTPRPTLHPHPGQPPLAFFKMNTSFGQAPLTVQFTDLSFNSPTNWTWNFGDGHTSTERNPVNTYTNAGTYSVSLTVKNAMGQSTTSRPIYVR